MEKEVKRLNKMSLEELAKEIRELQKDPNFKKEIKRFIEETTK
jgi:type III secretory pathway component EscU